MVLESRSSESSSSPAHPHLELFGITRAFGSLLANQNVHLSVTRGTIHAVVGENGAGKSTLLRIAAGLLLPDAGEVRIDGRLLSPATAKEALARGVGMVQQHFQLVSSLTVAENVVLGKEPHMGPLVHRRGASEAVSKLSRAYGLAVDPDRRVSDLSVGEQQRVEILKVLYREARLLILDEPTAVLGAGDVEALLGVLKALAAQGRTVVLVTHKLREVLGVSDQVTVMRQGQVVGTWQTSDCSFDQLASQMIGRSLTTGEVGPGEVPRPPLPSPTGEMASERPSGSDPVLEVRRLGVVRGGVQRVREVTFRVQAGEIVGLAGVQGNGQGEVAEAVAGLSPYEGEVRVAGQVLAHGVSSRLAAGMAHIPEDRHERGLILDFSVAENVILGRAADFSRAGIVQQDLMRSRAEQCIDKFDIRAEGPDQPVRHLSGGNQQKVVVARELDRHPRVLVAAFPTRGVDFLAADTIEKAVLAARDRGTAILLVSSEVSQLLALADRILVFFRGSIAGELSRAEATEFRLQSLMAGGNP